MNLLQEGQLLLILRSSLPLKNYKIQEQVMNTVGLWRFSEEVSFNSQS